MINNKILFFVNLKTAFIVFYCNNNNTYNTGTIHYLNILVHKLNIGKTLQKFN